MDLERALGALREEMAQLREVRLTPMAVTYEEAARLLSCSPKHIRRLVAGGELVPCLVGSLKRIPLEEIRRLVAALPESKRAAKTKAPRYSAKDEAEKLRRMGL